MHGWVRQRVLMRGMGAHGVLAPAGERSGGEVMVTASVGMSQEPPPVGRRGETANAAAVPVAMCAAAAHAMVIHASLEAALGERQAPACGATMRRFCSSHYQGCFHCEPRRLGQGRQHCLQQSSQCRVSPGGVCGDRDSGGRPPS
mmetsp:Transcript_41750/g.132822  ORF Transcript_41750/g.132822 Transcript_41750/m.132822 type:complete len:145 (+) Transcript_41750:1744-2178(+)